MELAPVPDRQRYALLISFGAAVNIDIRNGDGAYYNWMLDFFRSASSSQAACVRGFHAMASQTVTQPENQEKFNQVTLEAVDDLIRHSPDVPVLVVNWHMRFTGQANAHTGRGIHKGLVESIKALCKKYGKECRFILTVHEFRGQGMLEELSPHLDGIIALNPTVRLELVHLLGGAAQVIHLSQVPNFMRTQSGEAADALRRGLALGPEIFPRSGGGASSSSSSSSLSIGGGSSSSSSSSESTTKLPATGFDYDVVIGHWIARLKETTRHAPPSSSSSSSTAISRLPPNPHSRLKGILIFGTICGRHVTAATLRALALAIRKRPKVFDGQFKVVIAGNPKNKGLMASFKSLIEEERLTNISIINAIDTLDRLACVKYAISFDTDGYRDNASAMINVIRAGFLLFSRRSAEEKAFYRGVAVAETDEDLIKRALDIIAECEGENGDNRRAYYLAAQQGRSRRAAPDRVGEALDHIFHVIAFPRAVLPHPRGVLGTVLPSTLGDVDPDFDDMEVSSIPWLDEEEDPDLSPLPYPSQDDDLGDGRTRQQREMYYYGYDDDDEDDDDDDGDFEEEEEGDDEDSIAPSTVPVQPALPVVFASNIQDGHESSSSDNDEDHDEDEDEEDPYFSPLLYPAQDDDLGDERTRQQREMYYYGYDDDDDDDEGDEDDLDEEEDDEGDEDDENESRRKRRRR
ncbi:hypothetical protein HU811_03350 [Pseudomonas sp. SWRI196]|uniref:VWFA domain-containing protein n=1 Tax=Pseudomonas tehranensis TaxID=2745502 RepID=A0ABR6UM21_9PSED|nr:hypothetical protein [Pseudomonas tehranensis]MBC3345668.1 hypothetical protein [Pseudomonas tehranensis]